MSAHADVVSKYPGETMVKAACLPIFPSPNPPRDCGGATVGGKGAKAARSALLTVLCSIWNSVAKIGTFVHYICE